MYVLVVRDKASQRETRYVSSNRWAIQGALQGVEEMLDRDSYHWRTHDGSGWCDSSPDAHLVINQLNGTGTVVFL